MLDTLFSIVKKNPKGFVAILVSAILLVVAVVFSLAYLVDLAMEQFGADWSDFWGWVLLFAAAPLAKVWIVGKK